MHDVIWQGTGSAAKIEDITQGGKTGTSTGEGGATIHGWFAAEPVPCQITSCILFLTNFDVVEVNIQFCSF